MASKDTLVSLNGKALTIGQLRFLIYTALLNKTHGVSLDTLEGCKEAASLAAAFMAEFAADKQAQTIEIHEIEEWTEPVPPPIDLPDLPPPLQKLPPLPYVPDKPLHYKEKFDKYGQYYTYTYNDEGRLSVYKTIYGKNKRIIKFIDKNGVEREEIREIKDLW